MIELTCAHCDSPFAVYPSRSGQKYCSRLCGQLSSRAPALPEHFWSKVDLGEADACWRWTASRRLRGGYGLFTHRDQKPLTRQAHRVAYELAIGPIGEGLLVCHRCDNPPCCNPAHLFLGTHADNLRDMVEKGRGPTGERNPASKLRESDVLEIRALYASGGISHRKLARRFGVSQRLIAHVLNGRAWAHVAAQSDLPADEEGLPEADAEPQETLGG